MDKSNQLIISKTPKAVLSQELVSKINVSTTDIYHAGHKAKKYKTKLEESSKQMESFILSNTEKERQAVIEAMNALKSKVDCLKTEKQYKTLEDEMKYLENKLNIKLGQTTADGMFTLKAVECLGSCGSAPMLQCGVNYYENLTNEKADDLINKLTAENRLQSYTDIK
jgi:(2Fe-2S) ferredoxin